MIIRPAKTDEIQRLVEIWISGSLRAHDFIDPEYWMSGKKEMAEKYLPMSRSYVIEQNGVIAGFVSMVDDYLAALFVDEAYQKKGYGKLLLDYIKEKHKTIQLRVYKKNTAATGFYHYNGFQVVEEGVDEDTGQQEFVMEWSKRD
jgi:putative acetyltransferase